MATKSGILIGSGTEYPMTGKIAVNQEESGHAILYFTDFRSVPTASPQIHLTKDEKIDQCQATVPLPQASGSFQVTIEKPIHLEQCNSIVIQCQQSSAILGTAEIQS